MISETDAYPMPRIDDFIHKGGSCYTLTLDLTRDYWQIPVAQEDRVKTAFSTPYGRFQICVMPFGPQGAPATFQQLIDQVIHRVDFAAAYLDDKIVFSSTLRSTLLRFRPFFKDSTKLVLQSKPKSVN